MKLQNNLNIISDDKMRNAFLDFIKYTEFTKSVKLQSKMYFNYYKNIKLDKLNWETICDIATQIDTGSITKRHIIFGEINLKFIIFLIDNNLYTDPDIDIEGKSIIAKELLLKHKTRARRLEFFNKDNKIGDLIYSYCFIISDDKMRNAVLDFIKFTVLTKSVKLQSKMYFNYYKNIKLDKLNWETICDIATQIDTGSVAKRHIIFGEINLKFIDFLIDNKLYTDPDIEAKSRIIKELLDNNAGSKRLVLFNKYAKIGDLISSFYYLSGGKDEYYYLIDTKLNNSFVTTLLNNFYKTTFTTPEHMVSSTNFVVKFRESYDFSNFNNISDFNYNVFKTQFEFFKNNMLSLRFLIKFYINLYAISGYINLFDKYDPIDMIWLQRNDFLNTYKEGFKLVDYNPHEPIPEIDKWMVRPNGFEVTSTTLNSTSYKAIDFSKLDYNYYKYLAKYYFWHSSIHLGGKPNEYNTIVNFLNFIYEQKKISINAFTHIVNYKEITSVELYSFRQSLIGSSLRNTTINHYFTPVRKFLNLCTKDNLINLELGSIIHVEGLQKPKPRGGNALLEEDLIKLEKRLRELSEGDDINKLYYIIFHLLIETNIRISQLLTLQEMEIVELMKKGEFAIYSRNKTSNGDKEYEHISSYTKRHLDLAIAISRKLVDDTPDEYSDFVFLKKASNSLKKGAIPIDFQTFNKFIRRQCDHLGISIYSAGNLRDTHMTKALEFAFKHDLKDYHIKALSNHADSSTTKNHYFDPMIRTFVEATCGIIVGDVDIKGNIVAKNNTKFTDEDKVEKECGFCKEDDCINPTTLGCLMCNGFVATLDRIPFFKKRIDRFNKNIKEEKIEHEKEHLLAQKRLFTAYYEKLLILKGEIKENGK